MLLYASEVWGTTQFKVIESVQLFACKKILNVNLRTPNTMAYGETGRYPLYIDSTISSLRYWFTLLKMSRGRLPNQAFYMQYNAIRDRESRNQPEISNWAMSIKRCLDKYDFSEVWLNGAGCERICLKIFKQRMIDCYKQLWVSNINASDRYKFYRSFKSLLLRELYLSTISISKFRTAFVRFRLGICDLKVNRRFRKDDMVDMTCPFCSNIEDEVHFLLHCEAYRTIRAKYIAKYLQVYCPADILCKRLLSNENTSTTRDGAMFIFYSLKFREEHIHNKT